MTHLGWGGKFVQAERQNGERIMARVVGALAAMLLSGAAYAAENSAVPQFAFANGGWQAQGADFLAPDSGPGPVQDVPGRKRIGNNIALGQPTFRTADLSNPILQPWTRDALQKLNDHIAAGGGGFSPQVSCKPLG